MSPNHNCIKCVGCILKFKPKRANHQFCSRPCGIKWRKKNPSKNCQKMLCKFCGKPFLNNTWSKTRKYCCQTCHFNDTELPGCEHSSKKFPRPCKDCYLKVYRDNAPNYKSVQRIWMLKRKYGISPEQWEFMFKRQKGKCPICLRDLFRPDNKLGKRAAAVDHDHKNKRVRGLVCHFCNRYTISKNTVDTVKRLL